jgi:hypothetical protein
MEQDAPVVTEGPSLEAKEFVSSYVVVDVDGEARALDGARSYLGVRYGGGLDMWPLMERGSGDGGGGGGR